MSEEGRAPFISGWAFRQGVRSSGLRLLRKGISFPTSNPEIWIDFWLGASAPSIHSFYGRISASQYQ